MKAISLLLAALGGAGFLYRSQLQSFTNSLRHGMPGVGQHHEAPEGVYYLRTAYTVPTADGAVRWSAGQELRVSSDAAASQGFIPLTDGVNTLEVPQTAVTRDMDDAAALRQADASNESAAARLAARQTDARKQGPANPPADSTRLVSGQFHPTTLDAPAVRTNRAENIVSTGSAPLIYSTTRTVIIDRASQVVRRTTSGEGGSSTRWTRPASTPAPAGSR